MEEIKKETKKETNPELIKSVDLMLSEDFKDRFRAEYIQLKTRFEGLDKMVKSYMDGTLSFIPKCSKLLLVKQLVVMQSYLNILELRAEVENINLEDL